MKTKFTSVLSLVCFVLFLYSSAAIFSADRTKPVSRTTEWSIAKPQEQKKSPPKKIKNKKPAKTIARAEKIDYAEIEAKHNFFIYYSSNRRSILEPCGCKKTKQLGGIDREAGFLNSESVKAKAHLKLDAGGTLNWSKNASVKLRSEYILNYLGAMKFDAVNVNCYDMKLGLDFLLENQKKHEINFISANIVDNESGEPIFPPYKTFERKIEGIDEPVSFAVVGVTYDYANPTRRARRTVEERLEGDFDPPQQSFFPNNQPHPVKASRTQTETAYQSHSNKTLQSNTPKDRKKLAIPRKQSVKTESTKKETWTILTPEQALERYIPELKKKGYFTIVLGFLGSRKPETIVKKIQDIDVFISNATAGTSPVIAGRGKTVISRSKQGAKYINELMLGIDEDLKVKRTYFRGIEVYKNLPQDKEIAKLLENYKEDTKKLPAKPKAPPRKNSYIGALSCQKCHAEAYTIWKTSRHADAFSILKEKNQHYNPECVSCHTTGYNKPRGFRKFNLTPKMINVQCESCHGPASQHVSDMRRARTMRTSATLKGAKPKGMMPIKKVPESTCLSCHNEENDDDFIFDRDKKIIEH